MSTQQTSGARRSNTGRPVGRPATGHGKGRQFATNIPEDVLQALDDVASATGIPKWRLVERALRTYLPTLCALPVAPADHEDHVDVDSR